MNRIRWTLLLLAVAIGLPAALIVGRATESLELEADYRHETVAERLFDEMERTLSDFLVREEARTPRDYDRALTPPSLSSSQKASTSASLTGEDRPNPLAGSGREAFVLGWFSIDERGQLRTRTAGILSEDQLGEIVRTAFAREPSPPPLPESDLTSNAAKPRPTKGAPLTPGKSTAYGQSRKGSALGQEESEPAEQREESVAYEVLQKLNRAGSLRSQRQSKAQSRKVESVEIAAAEDLLAGADSAGAILPEAASTTAPASNGATADSRSPRARIDSDALADEASPTDASRLTPSQELIDPFVGRDSEGEHLVLSRSVWRGEAAMRQGFVLDRSALFNTLEQKVVEQSGLAGFARLDFDPPALSGVSDARYAYLHRFAEPFDGLRVALELEPLPEIGTTRSLYALSALLALAAGIGLFAIERMTRVVLEFAERRSNFVAAVSHELKTPLTSIRMYGEMLREGLVASEAKRAEYYETITEESERLSRLIDNVLEFSRLENDQRALELVYGNPTETVRAAVEKLRAHAERAEFELEFTAGPSLPRVRYDADALTQILFNLIDNAVKYAGGSERKRIDVELVTAGEEVDVRVRDYGPGIPEAERNRIFEPFYRIGSELTRRAPGTGIGLALVRELGEAMGGKVRIDAPPEGGIAVVVSLSGHPPA